MYAVGVNEKETPFSFGSAAPPLSFSWTLSNKDVSSLKPLFHESKLVPHLEGDFSKQFYAEEAGHVTVRLEVTSSSRKQLKSQTSLVDSIQIQVGHSAWSLSYAQEVNVVSCPHFAQVFEKLELIRPDVCDGTLLITPNTGIQLKTNRQASILCSAV